MQTPNSYLRFPMQYDVARLNEDLETCLRHHWHNHFNTNDYQGDWKIAALYAPNGDPARVTAHPNDTYQPTPLMAECPYFQEIINSFDCTKTAVRLMQLNPGSVINEHRDDGLSYDNGCFRIHIPIRTSDKVDFIVNRERVVMEAGTCWYANFYLPHAVANFGTEPRIHLVIDGLRNAWTDQLFGDNGYDFSQENQPQKLDSHTIMQMLDHLRAMNSPASEALIADLERQLAQAATASA